MVTLSAVWLKSLIVWQMTREHTRWRDSLSSSSSSLLLSSSSSLSSIRCQCQENSSQLLMTKQVTGWRSLDISPLFLIFFPLLQVRNADVTIKNHLYIMLGVRILWYWAWNGITDTLPLIWSHSENHHHLLESQKMGWTKGTLDLDKKQEMVHFTLFVC